MNLEKDELYCNPDVYIARSEIHRWGVFCRRDIKAYDVIQEAPYAEFKEKELKKAPTLEMYSYSSDAADYVDDVVIGFGYAAMYNHDADNYNCAYELDVVNQVMRHYALEDIPANHELTIDYGCGDWDSW